MIASSLKPLQMLGMAIYRLLILLILIFAGAARIVLRMSFASTDQKVLVDEKTMRVVPSFVLLLTSLALCFWLPDQLYQTIINAISVIGGAVNG